MANELKVSHEIYWISLIDLCTKILRQKNVVYREIFEMFLMLKQISKIDVHCNLKMIAIYISNDLCIFFQMFYTISVSSSCTTLASYNMLHNVGVNSDVLVCNINVYMPSICIYDISVP